MMIDITEKMDEDFKVSEKDKLSDDGQKSLHIRQILHLMEKKD